MRCGAVEGECVKCRTGASRVLLCYVFTADKRKASENCFREAENLVCDGYFTRLAPYSSRYTFGATEMYSAVLRDSTSINAKNADTAAPNTE